MKYFFSILGIIASFLMIKYRERVGDMLGEPEWMNQVGGIYLWIVGFAIFVFLWSITTLTGTSEMLFAPILWIIPTPRG